MKKLFTILGVVILLAGILLLGKRFLLSGKSSFQSIYLIPSDAVMIIESDAVFDAWNKIVHSDAWKKISHIEALAELNREINAVDSVVSEKQWLLKAVGKRKVLVSIHPAQSGEYENLYVLNIGRAARARNPENLLRSLLGDDYRLTTRDYKGNMIYEMLDQESGDLYIFSLVNDKAVVSADYSLVEAALDERDKMTLGRDHDFINVSKRTSGKGLFNIYFNFRTFPEFMQNSLGSGSDAIRSLESELNFAALSFDITERGMISLEGYTGVEDSVASFYSSVLHAGNGSLSSSSIIPARVASMVKISFDDAGNYYRESLASLNAVDRENYNKKLHKLERKLKISVEENFLDWMDDEIVLLQTQPSNLGRSNEFAAIVKARNDEIHKQNMEYVGRQIEKNMPVRIREVRYGDYTISYISFPGLLKTLFGQMLEKIEKPYYTFIGEYIIFSNHPQTLKNIIDDYIAGNTLENSTDYSNFARNFDKSNSAYTYFDIPVLYNNLREFVDPTTWQKLYKNKPYITSFPKAGMQIDRKDGLLHVLLLSEYSERIEDYDVPRFDPDAFLKMFSAGEDEAQAIPDPYAGWDDPVILIHDLDADEAVENYEEGGARYEASLKNGLKHGNYKAYYPSGAIMFRGRFRDDLRDGKWKLYDEEGNLIEEKLFSEGKESD